MVSSPVAIYDDEYEDPPPDALVGHASVEHHEASGLGDVVLSLIGELCKLQVAIAELEPDDYALVKPRLDCLRNVVNGLPTEPQRTRRTVKVVGFKPSVPRPRRRAKK